MVGHGHSSALVSSLREPPVQSYPVQQRLHLSRRLNCKFTAYAVQLGDDYTWTVLTDVHTLISTL